MIMYLMLSILIFIVVFYLLKKRIKRNAKAIKFSEDITTSTTDDTLDDYFSISLTNGGRITNAYGETISYCVPKKSSDK